MCIKTPHKNKKEVVRIALHVLFCAREKCRRAPSLPFGNFAYHAFEGNAASYFNSNNKTTWAPNGRGGWGALKEDNSGTMLPFHTTRSHGIMPLDSPPPV